MGVLGSTFMSTLEERKIKNTFTLELNRSFTSWFFVFYFYVRRYSFTI